MVGAHPRPHFSVDELVFMVLIYTETGRPNVLETIRRDLKAVSDSEGTVQTKHNVQLQLVCPVWFKFEQERHQ